MNIKKLFALSFLALLVASLVYAYVTYNCDGLTGGSPRDLDYISVNDLNHGDRAIVIDSETSSYLYFEFDSTSTQAENVTTHPYYVRPDDYVTQGVWHEINPLQPSLPTDSPGTLAGNVSWNTDRNSIAVGDGTNTRAILSGHTIYIVITSPDLLDDPDNQVLWRNMTGTTFYAANAFFRTSDSGTTLSVRAGASPYATEYSDGTDLWVNVAMDTIGGVSCYVKEYTSGTSTILPDYPIIMQYGGGSISDWVEIVIGGYLEGE